MRWNPRQYWFLAQFFQFQTPSELRDGLKSGAFKVRLSLAQGRASTDTHSGALPFHWTAIKTMIQSYQVPIVGEQCKMTNVPRYPQGISDTTPATYRHKEKLTAR